MSEEREQGVEFGDLQAKLEDHEYPASHEELLEAYGDEELEFGDETATFEELLEPLGKTDYESADEVEQAVMNMVGDEAIGRKNYSDRTPEAVGEERQEEGAPGQEGQGGQESF